jgi:hypothetical protein
MLGIQQMQDVTGEEQVPLSVKRALCAVLTLGGSFAVDGDCLTRTAGHFRRKCRAYPGLSDQSVLEAPYFKLVP